MKAFKNKFADFEFTTVYVTTADEAKGIVEKLDPKVLRGIDIETAKREEYKEHDQAGLCPHLSKIRLLQIYDEPTKLSYVFDLFTFAIEVLRPLLKNGHFVAHNAIFEIQHLTHAGFPNVNIGCSMLLSQMIYGAEHSPYEVDEEEDDEDQTGLSRYRRKGHNLDAVTQELFGNRVAKTQQVSDWGKDELDIEQITYAGLDALLTYKVAKALEPKLLKYKMVRAYRLLKDMQHVVAHMQLDGMPVDWTYHAELIKTWETNRDAALVRCKPYFGDTNMRSGKQMSAWLAVYLKDQPVLLSEWPKTEKGSLAFGKTVITKYKSLPPIAALLEYKKWSKLIDTYGVSLIEKRHPKTSRLHTSYTLGVTRTGRLSSRSPNIQNGPREKEFRNMFRADKDHVLVVSDFSQIELRLQAQYSQDPIMNQIYKDGEDIYCMMASTLFGVKVTKSNADKPKRFVGKTVMLALGFGMGPTKLGQYATNAGITQPQVFWDKAHKTYHSTFRTYSAWCDNIRDRCTKLGYAETYLGKRRKLAQDEIFTAAPNTVIQGSAAELMMRAMLICHERVKDFAEISATVHDEIMLHTHKKNAEHASSCLASSMNDAMKEMFPDAASTEVADAAYGSCWGDIKAEL